MSKSGNGVTPLKRIRQQKGLTLQVLAKLVESNTGNLSRIEHGKIVPTARLAERLAAVFAPELTEIHLLYPERFMREQGVCHDG